MDAASAHPLAAVWTASEAHHCPLFQKTGLCGMAGEGRGGFLAWAATDSLSCGGDTGSPQSLPGTKDAHTTPWRWDQLWGVIHASGQGLSPTESTSLLTPFPVLACFPHWGSS